MSGLVEPLERVRSSVKQIVYFQARIKTDLQYFGKGYESDKGCERLRQLTKAWESIACVACVACVEPAFVSAYWLKTQNPNFCKTSPEGHRTPRGGPKASQIF